MFGSDLPHFRASATIFLLMKDFEELRQQIREEIKKAADPASLEAVRVKFLGRENGILTNKLKELKNLEVDVRKVAGPALQKLKSDAEALLAEAMAAFRPKGPVIDITAPGKKPVRGRLHLFTREMEEIVRIFSALNFSVAEGPEAEDEWHNFDALNVAPNHPARDMWDTFWLTPVAKRSTNPHKNFLLRTHTSPVQIRWMQSHMAPFQIIAPGRVFRYEATDATHEINFAQLEGLMVGPNITFANFKYVVEEFFRRYFSRPIKFRYRPSFFPFTEPSVEVDIWWNNRWLEVAGAGMVNQRVFEAAGLSGRGLQGFAFGFGVDRLIMLKYKIPDIRKVYDGDLRFIRQF